MTRAPTIAVVLMGVSGVGKSVIAAELVARTGWPFAEGDSFHPDANRAKMAAGRPLTDEDRWPWLRLLATWIGEQEAADRSCVLTCSALRRAYRDVLRAGHPSVLFVHLRAADSTVAERIGARTGHYMPPALLASQLATLEPLQDDEPGVVIETAGPPAEIAARVLLAIDTPGGG